MAMPPPCSGVVRAVVGFQLLGRSVLDRRLVLGGRLAGVGGRVAHADQLAQAGALGQHLGAVAAIGGRGGADVVLQAALERAGAGDAVLEHQRADLDVGVRVQRRGHAADGFVLVLVDLGHDLHQALRAHAAFGVRVEAGLDRDHPQNQQRVDADLAPGQVSRLDQLRGGLRRHAVLAGDIVRHGGLLARAAERRTGAAGVHGHARHRDLRGQVRDRRHLGIGRQAPFVDARHSRQAQLAAAASARAIAEPGHRDVRRARRDGAGYGRAVGSAGGRAGMRGCCHGGAHQHRGRFVAGQQGGQGGAPFLAHRQRHRRNHRHHAQAVQGVLQRRAAAAQRAARDRMRETDLQCPTHSGYRLSEADLQGPPDAGKMKGFPTAHAYLHPLPASRARLRHAPDLNVLK
ncbi:protein of unknown function [Cupriavidus taiwanensis]|uniref:Uncharacterized protein n=1 Tax=Cupriavidus taiwanensis TaxID=164546 RepID=A0A375ICZ5_9BURK|nr:hypothetical protein CBM2629_A190064 [Cupriavidus taiwanensis]SPK71409.1 protein of unknown function [Cupriavidus taiwanensis]